ncbi:hypothetical protein [Paraburkholderia youngii]|uniref:hypothetical protein n=1 Tax=Paraburkholderia youngii TaxID=2782701 RepID=UPI003D1AA3C2
MASKENVYEGLGILAPILMVCHVLVKFTIYFSKSLYQMTEFAFRKVGEIQVERQANRVMQEQEEQAQRAAAAASSPAPEPQAAPAATASAAAGPVPVAARAAASGTAEPFKPAKAANDAPAEAPVSWPEQMDMAPVGATRSGMQGAEFEIADRHMSKIIDGKQIKLSMYWAAGRVERVEVKTKTKPEVRLKPYTRKMAEDDGVQFSLEAAQYFTVREIAQARRQKKEGKTAGAAQGSQSARAGAKSPETSATQMPEFDMSNRGEEPPPLTELPPDLQMGYEESFAPRSAGPIPDEHKAVEVDDSVRVDGETVYEHTAYIGMIGKMGQVRRTPKGKKPFETFEMVLHLDDGELKPFAGVDLAEKKLSMGLNTGDRISIQKGVHHFELVTGNLREPRTMNVYSIRVLSKAANRVRGYGRRAQA